MIPSPLVRLLQDGAIASCFATREEAAAVYPHTHTQYQRGEFLVEGGGVAVESTQN